MPASKIRADYDQLKAVATQFGGLAQDTRQTLQMLKQQMDTLQGGDWVGPGASAFFQEMGAQVVPSLQRLGAALDAAQRCATQISQIVAQAESDAARVLSKTPGPGGMPGPQQIAGAIGALVDTANAIGGSALAAAAVAGALEALKSGNIPSAAKAAIVRVLEEGAVDRKLPMLSQSARDLIKQSPTLRAEILTLEQNGYSFKTGPVADGYYTDRDANTIVIDQPLSDGETVSHVAHEVGHAVTPQQASIPATPSMTRDQYVRANVDNLMSNEGAAQFNAAQVRAELKASGGPDIGIPGSQTADYQRAYDDFAAGRITRSQSVDRMATLMGNETVSTPPHQAYRDYYADSYKTDWDTNIAPTRRP